MWIDFTHMHAVGKTEKLIKVYREPLEGHQSKPVLSKCAANSFFHFPPTSVGGQICVCISVCQPGTHLPTVHKDMLGSARFPAEILGWGLSKIATATSPSWLTWRSCQGVRDCCLINWLEMDWVFWSSFRDHSIVQGLQRSQLKKQGPNTIKISLNLKQASVNHITLWMSNLA